MQISGNKGVMVINFIII